MAAGDGLVSMTPTSIAHSGTSASINADGGVDFTAVTSLSLNGVFTSDYDNYLMVISLQNTVNNIINGRLRASGSDASGSNYATQYIQAEGSSVGASRSTSQSVARLGPASLDKPDGWVLHVYGPALAQPTAFRTVAVDGFNNATMTDSASTHSLSTSYDGITLIVNSGSATGSVHVFGYEE